MRLRAYRAGYTLGVSPGTRKDICIITAGAAGMTKMVPFEAYSFKREGFAAPGADKSKHQ